MVFDGDPCFVFSLRHMTVQLDREAFPAILSVHKLADVWQRLMAVDALCLVSTSSRLS